MQPIPLSVIMIAQNAERFLERALLSTQEFAEVIIIDGGSTDRTKEIATRFTNVKFYTNPWPGFIEQRNISIDKATYDWCLMIDSDEALTTELVQEIRSRLSQGTLTKKMYRIKRTEYLEHHAIETGFGRSDFQERLFQKEHVRYAGGNHHNHLIDGELCYLGHKDMEDFPENLRILHNEEYSLDEMIMKLPRFSILIAHEKLERNRTTHPILIFFTFIVTTLRLTYKSRKEGRVGFLLSLMEAIHRVLVKAYIYNAQETKKRLNDPRSQSLG